MGTMTRNIKKNIRNPRRGHRGKAELGDGS